MKLVLEIVFKDDMRGFTETGLRGTHFDILDGARNACMDRAGKTAVEAADDFAEAHVISFFDKCRCRCADMLLHGDRHGRGSGEFRNSMVTRMFGIRNMDTALKGFCHSFYQVLSSFCRPTSRRMADDNL